MDERVGVPENPRNSSFGERLRQARLLWARMQGNAPRLNDATEFARMAACLAATGYEIAPEGYGEVETSKRLPVDPVAFLAAVSRCLALSALAEEVLFRQLAYDILRQETDADLADEMWAAANEGDNAGQ